MIKTADRLQQAQEYYFSKKLEEVRKLKSQGQDVINLGIGSPDLVPSEETLKAAALGLQDKKNHGYSPYRSSLELRKGISDWYMKTYSVSLNAESEVLPLLGSKEGILYASLAFVNLGDKILIPDPGYPAYQSVAQMIGAQIEIYNLTAENKWMPDFDELRRKDLKSCKLMLVNYPHMPSGASASREVFDKLVAFGKEKQILICHDNPYSLVLNDSKPISILSSPGAQDVCVELNSFSKAFNMAGWRVGMLAGKKEFVDAVLQVKSNVDSGMFAPVQLGAIAALKNSDDWHASRNKVYKERKEVVLRIFEVLGFKADPEQKGLFVWARAPEKISNVDEYLDKILYEAQVFFVPGLVFGKNGARYARSSLCAPVEILSEALKRIEKWKGSQH